MSSEMPDSAEVERAKKRFMSIAQGRHVPADISIEEAKKRVRQTDPGLDISDIVRAIDQRDLKKAGTSLLLEVATDPSIITYWSPLLIGLVQALVPSSKKTQKADAKAGD
ncbi:hypothetical protein [Hydrogenimonas sp.]